MLTDLRFCSTLWSLWQPIIYSYCLPHRHGVSLPPMTEIGGIFTPVSKVRLLCYCYIDDIRQYVRRYNDDSLFSLIYENNTTSSEGCRQGL